MEFETLVLSRSDLCKLRQIIGHPAENNKKQAERLSALVENGLVSLQMCADSSGTLKNAFFITPDGENYIRYIRRRQKEFWADDDFTRCCRDLPRCADPYSVTAGVQSS